MSKRCIPSVSDLALIGQLAVDYSYAEGLSRNPDTIDCSVEPSLTRQEFADQCDILNIMHTFTTTGVLTHVSPMQGQYGDFSEVPDYETCLKTVMVADDLFMTLPPELRAKFDNDVGQFLAYASDPQNKDEMIKIGLIDPLAKPKDDVAAQPFVEQKLNEVQPDPIST